MNIHSENTSSSIHHLASHSIYVNPQTFSFDASPFSSAGEMAGVSEFVKLPPSMSSTPLPTKEHRMKAQLISQNQSSTFHHHDSDIPCSRDELIEEIKIHWNPTHSAQSDRYAERIQI